MAAKFTIVKYTGKDSDFGTDVSSIGLKRVDAAVPAVYGIPVVPGDDISDAMMYSVYRPDQADSTAYSFEAIFKLKLESIPDNQLSNVRIYPVGTAPEDPKAPILYIGQNSGGYSRPTNSKSIIATQNIWNFSAASPFYVKVGGISGTVLDPQLSVGTYNITQGDIGSGNVIYLNNQRQDIVQLAKPRTGYPNRSYIFLDRSGGSVTFKVYDPSTGLLVTHPSITTGTDGYGRAYTTILANDALLTSYPSGLAYGSTVTATVGSTLDWLDLDGDPITTETYTVEVRNDANTGSPRFYIDGSRTPFINFELNKKYVFNNTSGDTHPMRFMSTAYPKAAEPYIVINGISIANGGTVNEVISVDPLAVKNAGYTIVAYQSTATTDVGSSVTNTQINYVGAYNINTVGGGTNPMAAGETDYIYLQLAVRGDSTVGNFIPEIAIEYDEN